MNAESSSFRDPENAAFSHDGRWYRVASNHSAEALRHLLGSPTYRELVADSAVVEFEEVSGQPAADLLEVYRSRAVRPPDADARVFRVESLDVITYPWEWPNSLLQIAGLHTLMLRERLLEIGLDLKDASAFNIQFRGMRPALVDVGSIEFWRPNPSWNAARQYVEHFINPLAVGSGAKVTASEAWELSRRRGLRSEVARQLMPRRLRRRPSLWVLQASTKPVADQAPVETKYSKQAKERPDLAMKATLSLTKRLAKQTRRLTAGGHTTTWHDYGTRDHYGSDDLQRKVNLSHDFIGQHPGRERLVLDVGGNDGLTGAYLARNASAKMIVMDADAGALDVLSRGAGETPELVDSITPVLADMTQLTAASGLLDREFSSFTDRIRPSAVLCQAVLHHIVITQGIPMPFAVAALAQFGAPVLVEFANEDDPKVGVLLAQIPNWSGDYSTGALMEALERHFHDVEIAGHTSPTRVVVVTGEPKGQA